MAELEKAQEKIIMWNEAHETMSRDELEHLQGKRLVKLVKRMYKNVDYYRQKMISIGLEPSDICGIEDLHKLPFTTKEDLRQLYPFGMLAVPQSEIIRYHTSNGTTGVETIVGYTRNDIDIWSECVARCIHMAGLNRNDIIQIAYNYGMFTGGLGAHYGVEKMGAAVVPASMGNTNKVINMMRDLGVTGIMCTPSYLERLACEIESRDEINKIKLRVAVCGGESWSYTHRNKIEEILGIKTFDIYGLSEVSGPGVACECQYREGMHIQEDYFVTEILDKKTGTEVNEGDNGELVLTTLHKEGVPLIRYKTDDTACITRKKCKCGRTFARISKLRGSDDDMIMFRGSSVFPVKLRENFKYLTEKGFKFLIEIDTENGLDLIRAKINTANVKDNMLFANNDILIENVTDIIVKNMGMKPQECVIIKDDCYDKIENVKITDLRRTAGEV